MIFNKRVSDFISKYSNSDLKYELIVFNKMIKIKIIFNLVLYFNLL